MTLETFSHHFAKTAGTASGFLAACGTIILWFIAGFFVAFSENWQNAIQIYIAILTFLMIFLIQRSQNKEIATLQVKLDELIVVTQPANNKLVNAQELSEKEIKQMHQEHRERVNTEI